MQVSQIGQMECMQLAHSLQCFTWDKQAYTLLAVVRLLHEDGNDPVMSLKDRLTCCRGKAATELGKVPEILHITQTGPA